MKVALNIDSRLRNPIYSNSNSFTIELSRPMNDVKSIELISCEIPISYYNVNTNNNKLVIRENGAVGNLIIATIQGAYTASNYATQLQIDLNSGTTRGYVYSVSYNKNQNSITISSNNTFQMISATNCHTLIGYNNITTALANTWVSTNACDFAGERYVCLKIDNVPFLQHSSDNNYFAKIQVSDIQNSIMFSGVYNTYQQKKDISSSNYVLSRLNLSLCYYDGTLVDLRGLDYSITLLVDCES